MRYLTVDEVLVLYERIIETSGGTPGLRYAEGLDSAIHQPRMTFDGVDLYSTIESKAAALGYSLIANHPFADGNKRIGHAAMEVMLVLDGFEISAPVDEQERIIMSVASGTTTREELTEWLETSLARST